MALSTSSKMSFTSLIQVSLRYTRYPDHPSYEANPMTFVESGNVSLNFVYIKKTMFFCYLLSPSCSSGSRVMLPTAHGPCSSLMRWTRWSRVLLTVSSHTWTTTKNWMVFHTVKPSSSSSGGTHTTSCQVVTGKHL